MPSSHPHEHPGVHIARELEARGWIQSDLAFVLDVASSTVSNLVSGKKPISAKDSVALGEIFGLGPDHFLKLQSEYDLQLAETPPLVVQHRAMVQRKYPLREMMKRGWISASNEPLESKVSSFFGVDRIEDIPHINHAARKTSYDEDEFRVSQLAWLYRVRQIANEVVVPPYDRSKLQRAVEDFRVMLESPEEIRHVPGVLAECGVRYVVVEGLSGGAIDGVCFWLDDKSPVIGMSLRYDRIDNYWFVLRHEIEHVLNCDGLEQPIIDEDLSPSCDGLPEEEVRANKAAADFCVPEKKMDSFFHRKNPYFSRKDVIIFAKRMHVHPGLVVGQLQHRLQRWDYLRDLQDRVRDIITSSMPVDGWGDVIPVDS